MGSRTPKPGAGRPAGSKDTVRRFRQGAAPRSVSYTVNELFRIVNRKRTPMADLAQASSKLPASLSAYKYGRSLPSIATTEEMGHALGYKLVWVKEDATPADIMAAFGIKLQTTLTKENDR